MVGGDTGERGMIEVVVVGIRLVVIKMVMRVL